MGVRMNPCHGCPLGRDGCAQREEFRARVRGLGLRSATFNCGILAAELRIGRRVEITHPVLSDDADPYRMIERQHVDATITSSGVGEFSCVIDPKEAVDLGIEDKYRFRRTMGARRIVRFLDEPDAPLAPCGNVVVGGICQRREPPTEDERTYQCQGKCLDRQHAPPSAPGTGSAVA